VTVPAERAEQARALMVAFFPEGFEERDDLGGVELAAYTNSAGEERMWQAFGRTTAADVADGWEDRWRAFHRPVTVGGLWIGPPWETPPEGARSVVIDPGRAFGTGAHPTTRLCVELLAAEEHRGSVLDIGCGSGVLSIAAARLGFGPVTALDNDAVAVATTRANASANGVTVVAATADALADPLPTTDLAVANVLLAPVEAVLHRLEAPRAITSGYVATDRPRAPRWTNVARRELDGWAADLLVRERPADRSADSTV
jgi:ribosomal protein L11 methyltransferase